MRYSFGDLWTGGSWISHQMHLQHRKNLMLVVFRPMKRTSISIDDDLEKALEDYRSDQEVPPRLVDVVQTALREFLAGRGYARASDASPRKPGGAPRSKRPQLEGPDDVGAAVTEDRRSLADALSEQQVRRRPGLARERAVRLAEGDTLSEAVVAERESRDY